MRMPLVFGFTTATPPLRSSGSLLSFHVTASDLILVPVGNTSRSPFHRIFQYHAFPRRKSVPWPLALRLTFLFLFADLTRAARMAWTSADDALKASVTSFDLVPTIR